MKIVFLNIYNGLVNRGAERTTEELVKRLAKIHQLYLIQGGPPKKNNLYQTISYRPFFPKSEDTSFSFFRKYYLDLWSLQILLFTIRSIPFLLKNRFHFISPVNGGWQVVICKIICLITKSKMLIIGRAGIGRDERWNLFWHPDLFIALTKKAYDFAKSISSAKIEQIPNGIDLNVFKSQGCRAKITLQRPIILCVGALTPNKNIDKTIQAVSRMKKASLLVIGDGPLKDKLTVMGLRLLGEKRFKIISVKHEDMPKYYRAADLFSLASGEGEAFGNAYLEAMATNIPVVATDDSSRREIIGEAGIFVNPEDIESYATSLQKALSKNFINKPLIQARKFSWNVIIKKYEKLFDLLS